MFTIPQFRTRAVVGKGNTLSSLDLRLAFTIWVWVRTLVLTLYLNRVDELFPTKLIVC